MKEREVVHTGFLIHAYGLVSTGVKQFDSVICKTAVFTNYDQPTFRIFRSNNTGDYLSYIAIPSGQLENQIKFEGLSNLDQLSYLKHFPSDASSTGRVLLFL